MIAIIRPGGSGLIATLSTPLVMLWAKAVQGWPAAIKPAVGEGKLMEVRRWMVPPVGMGRSFGWFFLIGFSVPCGLAGRFGNFRRLAAAAISRGRNREPVAPDSAAAPTIRAGYGR